MSYKVASMLLCSRTGKARKAQDRRGQKIDKLGERDQLNEARESKCKSLRVKRSKVSEHKMLGLGVAENKKARALKCFLKSLGLAYTLWVQ